MPEQRPCLTLYHYPQFVPNRQALLQRRDGRKLLPQFRLSDEDQTNEELIVHLTVEQQANLFERCGALDQMRLVYHQNHALTAIVVLQQREVKRRNEDLPIARLRHDSKLRENLLQHLQWGQQWIDDHHELVQNRIERL